MEITCTLCGKTQPAEEFGEGRRQCKACRRAERKRHYAENREEMRVRRRAFHAANPEYRKQWNLKDKYGLTPEQAEALGSVCAICGQTTERMAIDHDHACCSGKRSCGKCVRGRLCHHCNTGLGNFFDSVERLESAIRYLKEKR